MIEEVEEPIKAWKQAKIGLDPVTHQVRFEGINSRTFYDVTDNARCNKRQEQVSFDMRPDGSIQGYAWVNSPGYEGATLNHWSSWLEEGKLPEKPPPREHKEPVHGCSCGFYSLKDRPRSVPGLVTLEVEHYGRILQHKLGYRAEFQRVLAVHFMAGQGVNMCSGPHHVRRDMADFIYGSSPSVRRSMGYGSPEQRQSTHVEIGLDGRIRNFMCFDCAKRELELASSQIWLKDTAIRAEFFDDHKQFCPRKFMLATDALPNFIGTDWVLDSAPYPWTATF